MLLNCNLIFCLVPL